MKAMVVTGVGAWSAAYGDVDSWLARRSEPVPPAARLLPARQRRRASELTRAAATAFHEAVVQAGAATDTLATVFGSAYGEGATLGHLLAQLNDDGVLSPMRFAGSVHNTASGALSIACDARGMTTSIAAGQETVAACLVEAAGLLAAGHPAVAVVVADCGPAGGLVDIAERFDTLAVAWVLRHEKPEISDAQRPQPASHDAALAVLSNLRVHPKTDPAAAVSSAATLADALTMTLPATLRRNPCAAALLLVDAIYAASPSLTALDAAVERTGDRLWTVAVSPAPPPPRTAAATSLTSPATPTVHEAS